MERSKVLERISEGKISRKDAAAKLGVSVRHLNRLMIAAGVQRPVSATSIRKRHIEEKKEKLDLALAAFEAGIATVEEAAVIGECSQRTIYRRLNKKKNNEPKRSAVPRRRH